MQRARALPFALAIMLVAAALATGSTHAQTYTESVLYSFENSPDGAAPFAGLVLDTQGNLYGTTAGGGNAGCLEGGGEGCGTVFEVDQHGNETVLYRFTGGNDGGTPNAGLVLDAGNLYGTTNNGGDLECYAPYGCGTVFELTPSPGGGWTESVLYSFQGGTNGRFPFAGLALDAHGRLYGTTVQGGNLGCAAGDGCGTVFGLTPNQNGSWTYSLLHTFQGAPDGATPDAGLVLDPQGNLYGTTSSGGNSHCGCGAVFELTSDQHGNWSENVLYSFQGGTDGYQPLAGLVLDAQENLYSTTSFGGVYGWGTVFELTSNQHGGWSESVLYSFMGPPDGSYPTAGVVLDAQGNLYGTTEYGGGCGGSPGCGTVFELTSDQHGNWSESLLYTFQGADGNAPYAGLVPDTQWNLYGTTVYGGSEGVGNVFELQPTPTLTVSISGNGIVTSTDGFINCPGTCSHSYPLNTQVTLNATPSDGWFFGGWSGACLGTGPCAVTMTQPLSIDGIFSQALQLVTVTPCRLVDTRNPNGPFGGPPIQGGTSRSFAIPQQTLCDIPASAAAYSLNVTVVPDGTLGYLTIWPTGEIQPVVSTLNSTDGRVKANAAIVPAGTSGAVSVYVSNTTNVILDIDGYFALPGSETYQFYPLTPCRIVDTRSGNGGILHAGVERDYTIPPNCGVPSSAKAYSFNVTVLPAAGGLDYLTVWPKGETQPVVSTLNDNTGTVVANAAIVPAGSESATAFYAHSNSTNLLVDIDGYFAAPGTGGYSFYPVAPCRVLDTRQSGGSFTGEKTVNVVGSACAPPSSAAAYIFNATVVPPGPMLFLSLWPDGELQPTVSTLNAEDGFITSNMAIVPTNNGSIDAYAYALTQLILDISGYFAP